MMERHAAIVLGDSNLHFSDTYLDFLPRRFRVAESLCGCSLRRASTAELVRKGLQQHGVEAYGVGWGCVCSKHYDKMNLESVLKAAKRDGVRLSMVIAVGQNDCFRTEPSQNIFEKRIKNGLSELAALVNLYMEKVFVCDPFDQKAGDDGAGFFGDEYESRVEILRRSWRCRIDREQTWSRFGFVPADDEWKSDHLHLALKGRARFAECIVAALLQQ